jgi:hypothetical protein
MRYRLRTLLISLGAVPPLVAFAVWGATGRFPVVPATLAVLSILTVWRAREVGRNAIAWVALLWILGYATAFLFAFVGIEVLIRVASFNLPADEAFLGVATTAILLSGTLSGAIPALFGAGRPRPTSYAATPGLTQIH